MSTARTRKRRREKCLMDHNLNGYDRKKRRILDKALDKRLTAKDDFKDILKMDGLRLNFEDDSWVLIRPSGTEPYFRVTSQAMTKKESEERLENYSKFVEQEIKKAQK